MSMHVKFLQLKRKSSDDLEVKHETKKPKRQDSEESPRPSKPSTSRRDTEEKTSSMRRQSTVSSTTSQSSSSSAQKGSLRKAKCKLLFNYSDHFGMVSSIF